MIDAESFLEAGRARGFALYSGVPCSYLTPFINYTIGSPRLRYIAAANEGDAVAIAAGADLGGVRSVVMFQNSGLGNAVNPLTSLNWTFRIPVLLIVTWRGEPGGARDEPQHELMGRITPGLLDTMAIPWAEFPSRNEEIAPTLDRAVAHLDSAKTPFALVMRKGSVADFPLAAHGGAPAAFGHSEHSRPGAQAPRAELLKAVQAAVHPTDVVVATTGYTGRELCALDDRASQLYMVGSMGCASSLGLGLAFAQPRRRVIVLDGDGAVLMRMGALTTIGYQRPPNLLHIVLDNAMHESTGGQATVSAAIDLPAIAAASGYPSACSIADPAALAAAVRDTTPGLRLIHVPMLPGIPAKLPRPELPPAAVAARFREFLARP
jgi:phosphonopyruvate decarboxylase